MNLAHWLQRSALTHPDDLAIAHGNQPWCTYTEFAERAARTASWLQDQGVQAGDRVALFMYNAPHYLPLFWGVWWAGAVVVPKPNMAKSALSMTSMRKPSLSRVMLITSKSPSPSTSPKRSIFRRS